MKLMRPFACLLLLSLSIGCRTSEPNETTPQKDYAVRAVFIEAPDALCLKLIGVTTSRSAATVAEATTGTIQDLLSSPQARTTEFPIVNINEGERVRIDKQRPLKYPTAYAQDGNPTNYATHGVGRLIEVNLKSVTNAMAHISYHIEDVAEPVWQTYGQDSSRAIKQPFFKVHSVSSDITLRLNQWVITGGRITEPKDGVERNLIVGVQVREKKSTQP
jgi:hypothetical protein